MNEAETKTELTDECNLSCLKVKLYKFRPLANKQDFKRLKSILKTGKFWCSKFSELNDPMEGSFTASNAEIIDSIYNEKEIYKICSFSNEEAFSNPIMWGHYANGFKGVVIEVEISSAKVKRIEYVDEIPSLEAFDPQEKVEKILTTKLLPWKHECEYRFLERGNTNRIKIGKITALGFGDPYERARNKENIVRNSSVLKEYLELKNEILEIVKDLEVYSVKIENCKVVKKIFPNKMETHERS